MKLYEVLKVENLGKVYKSESGNKIIIVEHYDQAAVALLDDSNKGVLVMTSDAINMEVEEVKKVINPYERPGRGQTYFFITMYNAIESDTWNNSVRDNKLYDACNCFGTEEEAKKIAKAIMNGKQIIKERKLTEIEKQEQKEQNIREDFKNYFKRDECEKDAECEKDEECEDESVTEKVAAEAFKCLLAFESFK